MNRHRRFPLIRIEVHGTRVLLDPIGVPHVVLKHTQGAPRSRRPWALLLNRFAVQRTSGNIWQPRHMENL